jgi:hypothetical protein
VFVSGAIVTHRNDLLKCLSLRYEARTRAGRNKATRQSRVLGRTSCRLLQKLFIQKSRARLLCYETRTHRFSTTACAAGVSPKTSSGPHSFAARRLRRHSDY